MSLRRTHLLVVHPLQHRLRLRARAANQRAQALSQRPRVRRTRLLRLRLPAAAPVYQHGRVVPLYVNLLPVLISFLLTDGGTVPRRCRGIIQRTLVDSEVVD